MNTDSKEEWQVVNDGEPAISDPHVSPVAWQWEETRQSPALKTARPEWRPHR
jgi:hypothetical protein